jgi:tetraacyldisaccharide 4'-kinase
MRTPGWWNSKNTLSTALLPIAYLYSMIATIRRLFVRPAIIGVPVIGVGNLTAGGGGKTPMALYIGGLFPGKKIVYLSKGYGGKLAGPLLVDPTRHNAQDVGDEPLLLAQKHQTVVSRNRVRGAKYAASQGADIIVMDDGLQNPTIAKTVSLVVIDGAIGLGNGRLIPAGPLREPAQDGLDRADGIVIIHRSHMPVAAPDFGKPIFLASIEPEPHTPLTGKKIVAFCGIAYPQKFWETLHVCDADVVEKIAFGDHHPYTKKDMENLVASASVHGAMLVTTSKDMVRIPQEFCAQVTVLPVALHMQQDDAFHAWLTKAAEKK